MNRAEGIYLKFLLLSVTLIGIYILRPTNLFFLGDDFFHIPESTKTIWIQQNSIRPIGNITLWIDHFFSKSNALGYHITNFLIHVINSFLVMVLCKKLFLYFNESMNKKMFPILIAVVFFLYPFHSEAIFWIIGRSASLGALFFILSLVCFLQYEKSGYYFIASLVSFQLAIFCYESSWLFPLLVSFLSVIKKDNRRAGYSNYIYVISIWLILIVNLFIISTYTKTLFSNYEAELFINFDFTLLGINFLKLFARTLLPPFFNHNYLLITLSVCMVVLLVLVIKFLKTQKKTIFFIVLSFLWLISYLPYLSIGIDTHGTEGERYLYLPSLFFCIWLLYLIYHVLKIKFFYLAITCLFIFQLFFLQKSRAYYEKAGLITQTTVNQLKLLTAKKNIYFENVPQYNKGAVVFRRGLYDAVKWLIPNLQSNIIIVSIDDSDIKPKPSHTTFFEVLYSNKDFPKSIKSFYEVNGKPTKPKESNAVIFNPNNDAMLVFSNSVLTIIK
jgi:hypothetical protein